MVVPVCYDFNIDSESPMIPEERSLLSRIFIPHYDELSLYLMSLSFILIFVLTPDLRSSSKHIFFSGSDLRAAFIPFIFLLGVLLSLYHVFTSRKKADWEKFAMLCFAVMANAFSGIAAGLYMLINFNPILILFPIWNIANGVLLLIMLRCELIDENNVSDEDADFPQVIAGTIIVVATFLVCRFAFQMNWAVTFSICVAYATNLSGVIRKIFSPLPRGKSLYTSIRS